MALSYVIPSFVARSTSRHAQSMALRYSSSLLRSKSAVFIINPCLESEQDSGEPRSRQNMNYNWNSKFMPGSREGERADSGTQDREPG